MILGVSHLILSSRDIEADSQQLQTLGYHTVFLEKNVPSYEGKNIFLYRSANLHSLAFCQHKNGTPVELIQYDDSLYQTPSFYQALFSPIKTKQSVEHTDSLMWQSVWQDALSISPELIPFIDTAFWFDNQVSYGDGLKAILVPVNDIQAAKNFWQNGLGCKCVAEGTTAKQPWIHMAFRSPVKNWSLVVILAEATREVPPPMLDDAGSPCLALLTTNLERDREELKRAGVNNSSGQFQLVVNQKLLKVEIFRGTNSELIELVEILSK